MRFRLSVGDDVRGVPKDTSDFVFSRREQAARPTGANIVEIFSLPPGGRWHGAAVTEGARVTLKQILILWLRTLLHRFASAPFTLQTSLYPPFITANLYLTPHPPPRWSPFSHWRRLIGASIVGEPCGTSNHLSIRVAADVDPYGVYRFMYQILCVHTGGGTPPLR